MKMILICLGLVFAASCATSSRKPSNWDNHGHDEWNRQQGPGQGFQAPGGQGPGPGGFGQGRDDRRETDSVQVTCQSENHHRTECDTGLARVFRARVVKQKSGAPCNEGEGQGWYVDSRPGEDKLIVDHGCRALFEVFGVRVAQGGMDGGGGWPRGGGGWDDNGPSRDIDVVTCVSENYRSTLCQTDIFRITRARMIQQLSKAPCEQDVNWKVVSSPGKDEIYVDGGCRAQFEVTGFSRRHDGGHRPGRDIVRVTCASENHQATTCDTGLRRVIDARVVRQLSTASCNEGQGWTIETREGNDNLIVTNGCRAEFEIYGIR